AVVDNPRFKLLGSVKENFDFGNEVNSEVVWAIQFSADPLTNNGENNGNKLHLYFGMAYDLEPGMLRDIPGDRPFRRFKPTNWLLNLFDRNIDRRYDDIFRVMWISNNAANTPS